jgi:hypothetical protein
MQKGDLTLHMEMQKKTCFAKLEQSLTNGGKLTGFHKNQQDLVSLVLRRKSPG